MTRPILNLDDKVLVVELNTSARSLLADVIKEFGFKNVETTDSVKSALGFLEVERVGWVVSPLQPEEPVNALQMLEIFSKYDVFKSTRLSLLIDANDLSVVPKAFELGALSFHARPFTQEGIKAEFQSLFETLETNKYNDTIVSSMYLKNYLKEKDLFKPLLTLSEKLYEMHPDSPQMLLDLAESYFLNNQYDLGKKSLGRAKVSEVPGWETLGEKYLKSDDAVKPELGLRKVVIVEPDEAVARSITEILKKVTAAEIQCFVNGEQALSWCEQNKDVDLVLQEWRIPGVSGPYFLQRLRGFMPATLPVVVLSSLVTRQDMPLLSEMGIANVIEKPLREGTFISTLVQTLQQELAPTLPESMERKIHQFLVLEDLERARALKDRVDRDASISAGLKKYLDALFAFYEERFAEAKTLAMDAIQKGAEQVKAFNLLGRVLAQMKDLAGACKCLMKAQELSPKNIERLCEIAAVQRDMDMDSAAAATIESAKSQDAGNETVAKEETKQAIKTGDTDKAKALMAKSNTPGVVVSEMNNTAVAYIAGGNFDKAKALYEKTIEAIPEENIALRARVLYNLALSYARQNELQLAKETLEKVPKDSALPVIKKVASLHTRISKSLKSGEGLNLKALDLTSSEGVDVNALNESTKAQMQEVVASEDGTKIQMLLSQIRPGGLCCFKVFSAENNEERWAKALETKPNFRLRAAIEREDAMGAEKVMKG